MPIAVNLPPRAPGTMDALSELGYHFEAAVADVVDNSIDAGATTVTIDMTFRGIESSVMIADNGKGMDPRDLQEAMRLGTEQVYSRTRLGKFGFGMKTASLSQCRKLLVASRYDLEKKGISAFQWDRDYLSETNDWQLLRFLPREIPSTVISRLRNTTGTVVLWNNLNKILSGYDDPNSSSARKGFNRLTRRVENHLSMVHHRFLERDENNGKVRIYLNGNELAPWDPFSLKESAKEMLPPKQIHVQTPSTEGDIYIIPYILPRDDAYSTAEAHRDAAGPKGWNAQQGLYIYRGDRLIQSGGWSGLFKLDEHLKLARVALFFWPELDQEFSINVSKMSVQIPDGLKAILIRELAQVRAKARIIYDGKAVPSSGGLGPSLPPPRPPEPRKPPVSDPEGNRPPITTPSCTEIALRELYHTATLDEQQFLAEIILRFCKMNNLSINFDDYGDLRPNV